MGIGDRFKKTFGRGILMKRIICALLSACMLLLLAACGEADEPHTETADPATQVENNDPMKDQNPENSDPPAAAGDLEDPSLAIFRQTMVETPQLFAAAYFGYVSQDADPFAVMQESAPQLCEDLPFLLAIREENIAGDFGHLFCIVPADENATVAVNRRPWNPQNESYDEPEVLYRSESGTPILVMCPNEDWIADTEISITDSSGSVSVWSPYLNPDYSLSTLRNDKGENLIFDFTAYDEFPNTGSNQPIDSTALIGTWDLTWTEIEGDQNKAEPGTCTIEITPVEMDTFRFTYTSTDYPEENVQDRELLVVPGELYPGCSNDQWIAEVTEEDGDTVQYALTLLADGTLLLQTYWEMDGMPWISYGWYEKIA